MGIEEKIAEKLEQLDPYQTLNHKHALDQAREILALPAEGWAVWVAHTPIPDGCVGITDPTIRPATLQDILDGKAVKG